MKFLETDLEAAVFTADVGQVFRATVIIYNSY